MSFSYPFPQALIAQKPASPRDSARLFVYVRKGGKVSFSSFSHLADYLPHNAVLVFNETKVLPARLALSKDTGGMVRVLYTKTQGKHVYALADRPLRAGQKLMLGKRIIFTVVKKTGTEYALKPAFPLAKLSSILEKYGMTPIPPYIKHSPLSERKLKRESRRSLRKTRDRLRHPPRRCISRSGFCKS